MALRTPPQRNTASPAFRSAALDGVTRLDYGDVILLRQPPRTTNDPRLWAETMFSIRAMPRWVVAALGLRALLAPLLRLEPAPPERSTSSASWETKPSSTRSMTT